jgi:GGDEF domain-containing protein
VLAACSAGWLLRRGRAGKTRLASRRTNAAAGGVLCTRNELFARGRDMLDLCRRGRRQLSLAVFDCSDLLEVRRIYNTEASRKLAGRIVARLSDVAGSGGIVACTKPAQFAVLVPLDRAAMLQAITQALGKPARIEMGEIVVLPDFAVDTIPEGGSVEALYEHLCRRLARTHEEENRRLQYLKLERESHSRPMPLMPVAATRAEAVPATRPQLADHWPAHQIPPTMPMPLAGLKAR